MEALNAVKSLLPLITGREQGGLMLRPLFPVFGWGERVWCYYYNGCFVLNPQIWGLLEGQQAAANKIFTCFNHLLLQF